MILETAARWRCLIRMRRSLFVGLLGLVAAALTAPAWAESFIAPRAPIEPRIEPLDAASLSFGDLGDPLVALEGLGVALELGADHVRAEVRFRVTTSGLGHREVMLPLALPRGATVHTLAVDTGDGRSQARAIPSENARDAYQYFVMTQLRDPGLLELHDRDARTDHLQLHLYPITRTAGANIELAIELPRTEHFAIDPGPNALATIGLTIDGAPATSSVREPRQPLTIALPGVSERGAWLGEPVVPSAHVDEVTSLFAGPPPSRPGAVPTVRFGGSHHGRVPWSLDKRAIRAVVKLHMAQLTECFMHEAQYGKPDLAGTAVLHFTIGATGEIASAAIDGDLQDPAVTGCLQREVKGWTFYPSDARTEVFYPLVFRTLK